MLMGTLCVQARTIDNDRDLVDFMIEVLKYYFSVSTETLLTE